MKKSMALFAMLTSAFVFSTEVVAKEYKEIRIATEGAFKPYNFKDTNGELKGFDIDVANDLCKRMEVKCTISEQAWKGIIPALKVRKYDAIIAGMNATEKRKKAIGFSRPYAIAERKFYVREDSKYAGVTSPMSFVDLDEITAEEQVVLDGLKKELKGAVVGVQAETILEAFVKKYMAEAVEIRTYDSQESLDLDVESGRLDLGFASASYLLPLIKDGKKFKMVGAGFAGDIFGNGISVGVRHEDKALADKFSAAINEAMADGTIEALSQKWFGFSLKPAQ
ncbi:transporter substrate-binding domain-containing protein [Terasakiella pusilla]|uniref:transporter substrate-binding domain-containing protein n=1 Tax=Terasakiella pusilla TaxID=64973 RepID=UPI003AA888DD